MTLNPEQVERFIALTRTLSGIARTLAESMTELADTAEDLVALWDEQGNDS